LTGLDMALSERELAIAETDWQFVSNSSESVDSLMSRGAAAALVGASKPVGANEPVGTNEPVGANERVAYEYLAFNSPSAGVAA